MTMPAPRVRGIVRDRRGRWLLIRPIGVTWWGLPGGKVKRYEPPSRACVRELQEELGVSFPRCWHRATVWDATGKMTVYFDLGAHSARYIAQKIRLQYSEVTAWRWAAPEEALPLMNEHVRTIMLAIADAPAAVPYIELPPSCTTSALATTLGVAG